MTRRTGIITFIIILLAAAALFISAGASFVPFYQEKVIPNVYAGKLKLEGMTRKQGIEALNNYAGKLKQEQVLLYYEKQSWLLSLEKTGLEIDAGTLMDRALQLGHRGPVWKRWREKHRIKENGLTLPLTVKLDRKKIREQVNNLLDEITRPPRDAGFEITAGDTVQIVPGQKGIRVDYEVLYNRMQQKLARNTGPLQVAVPLVEVSPSRTVEDVKAMGINGMLSSYSTQFDPENDSRNYNIKVAATALDGLLVPPGKEISFNEVVGPRSTEKGYKNAKVILDRELVEGIGGGVCQVSSTLYNAVLLAGLKVTERNNHTLPISYVPLGRDATVAYDYLDLCFRNNSDSYILIKSSVDKDNLGFKIYGDNTPPKDVSIQTSVDKVIEPEVVYKKDSSLAAGEEEVRKEGIKGYKVSGTIIINTGESQTTRPLPGSYYPPRDKIIAVGTGGPGGESDQEEEGPREEEKTAE